MIVEQLVTRAFRNLSDQTVLPHERFNVLSGDNAQGKTNFLEALNLVATLRPFRATRNAEVIRFGAERAVVRANVRSMSLTRHLEVDVGPAGKKVRSDGKAPRTSVSYLEGLSVVLFTPDDLQVPRGSPGPRRKLLDRSVANVWPAYVALCRDYQKVLTSRNRVLKQGLAATSRELLEVYDQQLSELGAAMVAGRMRYLQSIEEVLSETFASIVRSGVCCEVSYKTSDEVAEAGVRIADLTQVLRRQLRRNLDEDLARKSTRVGPHTDDVEFLLDGRSTRSFGSQGQVRAVVLALRIAQIKDTFHKLGFHPVLLLDDVSSELDSDRNTYLFDFLSEISCQTFLTTTRPDLISLQEDRMDFQVVKGSISALK